jgi:hypothetical protein
MSALHEVAAREADELASGVIGVTRLAKTFKGPNDFDLPFWFWLYRNQVLIFRSFFGFCSLPHLSMG